MRDMFINMEGDDIVGRDGFLTDGTSIIKGTKVAARTGRVVVIKLGVHGVGGVLLSSHKVNFAIVVCFERRAKRQNNYYECKFK